MINYRKLTAALIAGTITCFSVAGCSMPWDNTGADTQTSTVSSSQSGSTSNTSSAVYNESDSDISIELDEDDTNVSWNEAEATKIEFTQNTASINGSGATVDNSKVTITSAGTYVLSGTLTDGCLDVNVSGKGIVRIILNGVNITSSTNAPFIVEDAKKVVVTLADGTNNVFTDSTRQSEQDEDYSAAITSKADITFNGNGSLTVNAGYRNGIKSSDDLKFVSGTYNITSNEDGIVGKDLLSIKNGTFNITAGQDGMKSTYDSDDTKGNIIIDKGAFNITASTDGIQSEHILRINGGDFNIKTGGGYQAATKSNSQQNIIGRNTVTSVQSQDEESMKGLKAGTIIRITGGSYVIDSQDDALHTNGNMYVDAGKFTINAGDDAFHADTLLVINSGTIDVNNSYEGIESLEIIINGGDINVTSSDDGINAASGSSDNNMAVNGSQPGNVSDMSGQNQPGDMPDMADNVKNGKQLPGMSDENQSANIPDIASNENNGMQNQKMPDNTSQGNNTDIQRGNMSGGNMNKGGFNSQDSSASITINGGNLYVNALGDGIDANGSIYINGGTVIVCGPTSDGDTALDFDNSCEIKGGTVMAFGSSGMLEIPTNAENGACIVTTFSSVSSGTEYSLKDSNGNMILSYTPSKSYSSAIVYSSDISVGNTYTVNAGSTSQSVTVNNAVTSDTTSGGASSGMGNKGFKTR